MTTHDMMIRNRSASAATKVVAGPRLSPSCRLPSSFSTRFDVSSRLSHDKRAQRMLQFRRSKIIQITVGLR